MSFEVPHSVDIFLPPHVEEAIRGLVEADEYLADIEVIHEALWLMRNRELGEKAVKSELVAELREALDDPRPGTLVTPQFWEDMRRRTEEWVAWIRTQDVRNTLLPEKLHRFVTEKVASGEYTTPTDVVMAALRHIEPLAHLFVTT